MQRSRRLASIAVIVVAGVVALSGCRSEPGVAAYVGDREITEDQVTEVVDDAVRKLPEPSASPDVPQSPDEALPPGVEPPKAPSRADVVKVLVFGGVCEQISAEKGYQPQGEVPAEQVGQQLGVPSDSTYARLTAELYGCLSGIPATEQVTPTREDLTSLVERARQVPGLVPPGTTNDDAARRLDVPQYRSALATRKALSDAVAQYDVVVNPRYRPLEFPVLIFQGNIAAVSVPVGEAGPGTVVDAR